MSENQQTKRPEQVSALESLKYVERVAGEIRDSALSYLAAIEETPRAAAEPGAFYRTFDGSLVFVIRQHTRCQCAICTGRIVPTQIFGGLLTIGLPAPQAEPSPEPQGHTEPAPDEPKSYWVTILRGGHGIKSARGEKPGEQYVVDASGLALIGNTDTGDGDDTVGKLQLALAGLSLRRRLNVSFQEQES